MSLLKNLILLCLIGFFLAACGAGTNDAGPKKPAWASESPGQLFN